MRVVLINYEQTLLSAYIGFLGTFPDIAIVGAFRDGEEALSNIQALQPRIALIDLDDQGACDMHVLHKLRGDIPDLVIIAVSNNATEKFGRAVIQAGANAFVSKPRLIPDLVRVLRHQISKLPHDAGPTLFDDVLSTSL